MDGHSDRRSQTGSKKHKDKQENKEENEEEENEEEKNKEERGKRSRNGWTNRQTDSKEHMD